MKSASEHLSKGLSEGLDYDPYHPSIIEELLSVPIYLSIVILTYYSKSMNGRVYLMWLS